MAQDIEYSLLENGLDFIDSALELLSGDPSARKLKNGFVLLAAGVELVLKYRLELEHWTLIYAKPELAQLDRFDAGDFISVSISESPNRLQNTCGIEFDGNQIKLLKSMSGFRNRIIHFKPSISHYALKAVASDVTAFVLEFIHEHYEDPELPEHELVLIESIRSKLSSFEEFQKQRWQRIKDDVEKIICPIICPFCNQKALNIKPESAGLVCHYCTYSDTTEDALDRFRWESQVLSSNARCPRCETRKLVDMSFVKGWTKNELMYVCFHCGETWFDGDIEVCEICDECFIDGEGVGDMCNSCYQQRLIDND